MKKNNEWLELLFALIAIAIFSLFLTVLPLVGTLVAGILSGILTNPEYEASGKKSKKIYFSLAFLGATEAGIALAIFCISQTINLGWGINIGLALLAIPGYFIGYHFTNIKTEVDEENATLSHNAI